MASARRITIEFLGNDRSLGKTARAIEGKTSSLGSKLAGVGKMAGRMGLAGAAGFAVLAKSAIGLEAEFGKTMNVLAATLDAPKREMESLTDLAMKMGSETVFSANDASKAMLELARGGMNAATIQGGALHGTLTLAAAGELEMGEAANIAVKSMGQFNIAGKDMDSVAAALAGGANASSASVRDMSQALAQGGLAANSVGFSIQETTAAFAAFSNAGMEGSDAGTTLKTMLDRLQPATSTAREGFKQLGLLTEEGTSKFVKANGEFRSAVEIAELLKRGTEDLTAAERKRAITQAFGSDAQRAATVFAQEGADGLTRLLKATSDQNAAQKMAASNMRGTAGAIERLRGAAETAQLMLGRALAPTVIKIADVLSEKVIPAIAGFITGMTNGEGAGGRFAAVLASIVDAISSVARDLGPAFDSAVRLARKSVAKIQEAFAGIRKLNLGGVAKSLAKQAKAWADAAIDGFQQGLKTGDWSTLGETVGEGLVKALTSAGSAIKKIGAVLSGWFQKVDWMSIGIAMGKQAPTLLVGLVVGLLNFDVVGLLKGLADHWQEALLAVLTVAFLPAKIIGVVGKLLARIPFVGKLLQWGLLAFKKFSDKIVGAAGKALKALGGAFMSGFRKVFPTVGKSFFEALKILPTRLQLISLAMREKVVAMLKGMAAAVGKGIVWVVSKVGELIARMLKPFANAGSWLVKKGQEVVAGLVRGLGGLYAKLKALGAQAMQGLVHGVLSLKGYLLGIVANIALDVANKMKSALRIKSPSLVMKEIGVHIMEGLVGGIDSKRVALAKVLDKVTGFVKAQADKLKGLISDRNSFAAGFSSFSSSVFGADMTDPTTGASTASVDSILAFQRDQKAKAEALRASVRKLVKMGLSKDLIRQMAASGEAGIAQIHALASGSASDVKELNALAEGTSSALNAAGMAAGNALYGGQIATSRDEVQTARRIAHFLERLEKKLDKDQYIELKLDGNTLLTWLRKHKRRTGTNLGLA